MKTISTAFIFILTMLFNGLQATELSADLQGDKLEKIKLSIKKYVIEKFNSKGTYSGYSFGDLTTIKPTEILELDQLLSLKTQTPLFKR